LENGLFYPDVSGGKYSVPSDWMFLLDIDIQKSMWNSGKIRIKSWVE